MEQPSVFISYSRKDEEEKDGLLSHLAVIPGIYVWSDDQIGAGANWEQEIETRIAQAKVAILVVTANFLSSDFIRRMEVPRLLERQQKEGLTIIPIIARSCAWQRVAWLNQMNVRPRNAVPIWRQQGLYADEDLATIADEVANIVMGHSPKSITPPSEVRSPVKPAAEVREVPGNDGREKRPTDSKRWVSRALGGAIVGATAGTLAAPNDATLGWLIGGALSGAIIGLLSEVIVRALVGEIAGLLGEIIVGTLVGAIIGVSVGVLGWMVNELIVEALAEELIAGAIIGGLIGGIVGAIGWRIRGSINSPG